MAAEKARSARAALPAMSSRYTTIQFSDRTGSKQHSKKANHHAERVSGNGAKTAGQRPDEKTTGTEFFALPNLEDLAGKTGDFLEAEHP